jgi:hypothetical protein
MDSQGIDNLWPISTCPRFLTDNRDTESAKLNYRLFFGKPWKAKREICEWITEESLCGFQVNKWISQKYPLRCTALTRNPGDSVYTWEVKIADGVYISYTPKIPSKNEQDLNNPNWELFYINFFWKDEKWNGTNPFSVARQFLKHLERMPENPLRAVYFRVVDVVNDTECEHLQEALGFLKPKRISKERLSQAYRRTLGAIKTKQMDVRGMPYSRIQWWKPTQPCKDEQKFEFPMLLEDFSSQ